DASDPSLDVVSADVATNATTLTWVMRVRHLVADPDSGAPLGRQWSFGFSANGKSVVLIMNSGPFGPTDEMGMGAKVTLDTAHNQVRYSVPLRTLASYGTNIVPGATRLTGLVATTATAMQYPGPVTDLTDPLTQEDSDTSTASYLAGSPSCVTVGS
ncbi:MAG: hypothetical protein ACYDAQ_20060, partial [Mycobacteriales bacterium]